MYINLLDRAKSYLSGGQRSTVVNSDLPSATRESMIRQIDAESEAKINAMNNVELLRLIQKVLGTSLKVALEENGNV